jgi:hypothetical protein
LDCGGFRRFGFDPTVAKCLRCLCTSSAAVRPRSKTPPAAHSRDRSLRRISCHLPDTIVSKPRLRYFCTSFGGQRQSRFGSPKYPQACGSLIQTRSGSIGSLEYFDLRPAKHGARLTTKATNQVNPHPHALTLIRSPRDELRVIYHLVRRFCFLGRALP